MRKIPTRVALDLLITRIALAKASKPKKNQVEFSRSAMEWGEETRRWNRGFTDAIDERRSFLGRHLTVPDRVGSLKVKGVPRTCVHVQYEIPAPPPVLYLCVAV